MLPRHEEAVKIQWEPHQPQCSSDVGLLSKITLYTLYTVYCRMCVHVYIYIYICANPV